METVHTLWNWVVCSILTAVIVVRAQCPADAIQQVQLCTANLGIGPPSPGPKKFVQFGQIEKAKMACRKGLFREVLSCLRAVTDVCTGNTDREHFLRMMVDPDTSEKSVNYFCKNLNIYEENTKCIKDTHPEVSNCTHEVSKNFKTKVTATSNIDVMMTSTCRFYSTAVSCSSKVIKRRCGKAASNIVVTILKGFQPPKCLEMTFDEGTYNLPDDDDDGDNDGDKSSALHTDSSVYLLLCPLLWCLVVAWNL